MASQTPPKRRRLQGACDICRTRKIRCDSAKMLGNICSNCRAFGSQCTHLISATSKKKKGHKTKGENDLQDTQPAPSLKTTDFDNAKTQIAKILSTSTPYQLPTDRALVLDTLTEIAKYACSLENELNSQNNSGVYPLGLVPSTRPEQDHPAIDLETSDEVKGLKLLRVNESFFGKDSHSTLVKLAMNIRNDYLGNEAASEGKSKNPEFWEIYPWQKLHDPTDNLPSLVFPDQDLLDRLVELYFAQRNSHMPLLHRGHFEQSLRDGLHKENRDFGELVLSVCGLAARYTDDIRVFSAGTNSKHSHGWKYIKQIVLMQDLNPANALYRVQIIVNAVMFLQSTSTPGHCWSLLGLGVRFAQIVGAHRRNAFGSKLTLTAELWKRAFWCLVAIDTYMSAYLDRPRATNPTDYDLELPIECDDEYLVHSGPELVAQQPPEKPCRMTYWIHYLKLLDIFGLAQRSIYAVKKPERWTSDSPWDDTIILELDAKLNIWADTIPEHLRWNLQKEDPLFFIQSACLYCNYYWVQIQIHRPGIISGEKGNLTYSSLAVCLTAARSSAAIFNRLYSRLGGEHPFAGVFVALSNSIIILLLNLWSGKRLGLTTDPAGDMRNIEKCLVLLRAYQSRWQIAGRMCDIISELISVGNAAVTLPPTARAIPRSLKRPHEDDYDSVSYDECVHPTAPCDTSSTTNSQPSGFTNSPSFDRGIPLPCTRLSAPSALDSSPFGIGLPLYTKDLGRSFVQFKSGVEAVEMELDTQAQSADYPNPHMNPNMPYLENSLGGFDVLPTYDEFGLFSGVNSDASMQAQAAIAMFDDTSGGDRWDEWDAYIRNNYAL